MKITYEAETTEERAMLPEPVTHEGVYEFALCGEKDVLGVRTVSFGHLHVQNKYHLMGQLYELIERLRGGS